MSDQSEPQEVFSAPPTGPDPTNEVIADPANELFAVATIAPSAVEVDAFAKAAAHLQMFDKLRTIALRMTRPTDWHLFGDRPWPMRGAAEKIMRGLGLNLKIHQNTDGTRYTKKRDQDDLGIYYIITVAGELSGEWGQLEGIGLCSSRDQFFAWDSQVQAFKPLSQVKEENLIQAAYTNLVANLVMRYTGISGFTMADLEGVYGKGQVAQHTYREGAPKKTAANVAEGSAQMKELAAICMVMGGGAESEAAVICEALSAFTGRDGKPVPGKRSPRDLTAGRLTATLGSARKRWDEFISKAGDQAGFYKGLLEQRLTGKPQGGDNGEAA